MGGVLARPVADEDPMAALINGVPKFVASRTLDDVAWENSTLLGPDLAGEVTSLKELPGKDIAVTRERHPRPLAPRRGAARRARADDPPDRARPGRAALRGQDAARALELVSSEAFGTGVLNLTYRQA